MYSCCKYTTKGVFCVKTKGWGIWQKAVDGKVIGNIFDDWKSEVLTGKNTFSLVGFCQQNEAKYNVTRDRNCLARKYWPKFSIQKYGRVALDYEISKIDWLNCHRNPTAMKNKQLLKKNTCILCKYNRKKSDRWWRVLDIFLYQKV